MFVSQITQTLCCLLLIPFAAVLSTSIFLNFNQYFRDFYYNQREFLQCWTFISTTSDFCNSDNIRLTANLKLCICLHEKLHNVKQVLLKSQITLFFLVQLLAQNWECFQMASLAINSRKLLQIECSDIMVRA